MSLEYLGIIASEIIFSNHDTYFRCRAYIESLKSMTGSIGASTVVSKAAEKTCFFDK